jgi:DNA-binding HxlR family transcriptional regulator
MSRYGQFCPVSKTMELLDERWTMLVIRELLMGSRSFNDLRRGVPRMSPALLSTRLQMLARKGVIERHQDGARVTYTLTKAGRELGPIVEAIGAWGVRWIPELGDEDLDPHLLMWDIHRNIDLEEVPPGRTVLRFTFRDIEGSGRDWWLVIKQTEGVDLCDFDPGGTPVGTVDTDLRTLTEVWMGDRVWADVMRTGRLRLEAPVPVRRAVPRWLKLSVFAAVQRPA